jgi:hypothetical protein
MTETEQTARSKPEGKGIPALDLQVVAKPGDQRVYQLRELLSYHDRAFVINTYLAIRKHGPTQAELEQKLAQLRAGRLSKTNIITNLLASQSEVRVEGLPASPSRVGQWPVIGPVLRVLKAVGRLPLLIKHQQEFETFALAQQQQIADYINDILAPAFMADDKANSGLLAATVADAVATVSMLADSLVDLSAQQAEIQTRLQKLQEQREQSEAQFHKSLVSLTEGLAALQHNLEQAETTLHADLIAQQQHLNNLRDEQHATAASQREFLFEEQRLIVEAQQLVLKELQDQLLAVAREQESKHRELVAETKRLRALIEPPPPGRGDPEVSGKFDQQR